MNIDLKFLFTWVCIILSIIIFGNIIQEYFRTNQKVEEQIACISNTIVTIKYPISDKIYVRDDVRFIIKPGNPYSYFILQRYTNDNWVTLTNIPSNKW